MSDTGFSFAEETSHEYENVIGRYSRQLAKPFADHAGVVPLMSTLDAGCGPGALTAELVRRLGAASVSAFDPTSAFVQSCAADHPDANVVPGSIEAIPFADHVFDVALAQLVLHFVDDPDKGMSEMIRVTRPGGVVAAAVWDLDGGKLELVRVFAGAALTFVPPETFANLRPKFGNAADAVALFERAGLSDIDVRAITVSVTDADVSEYWAAMRSAASPVASLIDSLSPPDFERLRTAVSEQLDNPTGAFTLSGTANSVVGRTRVW